MGLLQPLKQFAESLNERERRLLTIMATMVIAVVVFVPMWLTSQALSDLADENAEIRAVLSDMERHRDLLTQRREAMKATMARYNEESQALSSVLEGQAKRAGYDRPLELTSEPDKALGAYTRSHVLARLQDVPLRTAILLLSAIENIKQPVAIERIHIDHFRPGDSYDLKVGVFNFARNRTASGASGNP